MEAGQTELNAYTLKKTQREMLAVTKTTEIWRLSSKSMYVDRPAYVRAYMIIRTDFKKVHPWKMYLDLELCRPYLLYTYI